MIGLVSISCMCTKKKVNSEWHFRAYEALAQSFASNLDPNFRNRYLLCTLQYKSVNYAPTVSLLM